MTELPIALADAQGLSDAQRVQVRDLVQVFNQHRSKNAEKNRYYEGHIPLSEVNLGIALPGGLKDLEIGCSWGAKTVDVLASRSLFDGFVGANGEEAEAVAAIMNANRMRAEYQKACRDELKYGCTFATLSADPKAGCRIRFHSPETAAALWDGQAGRISCGLAVIDTLRDETEAASWNPSVINLYTEDAVVVLRGDRGGRWAAQAHPHRMGRPLMEPLVWNATSRKPFGRSRLKAPIRRLIQSYVRTIANATIGLEFSTAPQKYLLGLTDDQYDAIVSQKFRTYVGSLLAATTNPDTGENPQFGQLAQGTIEPHVQMIRLLATQFSAATGLSVTDTGVVNDANPSSSDAILAQTQTLVLMAEQLNAGNGDSLAVIARMAQAIAANTTMDELPPEARDVIAHFKNPAMPSVAMTADAAVKIAGTRPAFAKTDVYLEMIGFGQADIRRIRAQEDRASGDEILRMEFGEEPEEDGSRMTDEDLET